MPAARARGRASTTRRARTRTASERDVDPVAGLADRGDRASSTTASPSSAAMAVGDLAHAALELGVLVAALERHQCFYPARGADQEEPVEE